MNLHNLWCWECRNVRPPRLRTWPNENPLFEPFSQYILTTCPPEWCKCPKARATAQAFQEEVALTLRLQPSP